MNTKAFMALEKKLRAELTILKKQLLIMQELDQTDSHEVEVLKVELASANALSVTLKKENASLKRKVTTLDKKLAALNAEMEALTTPAPSE
jgi:chromosome segregation ATPase